MDSNPDPSFLVECWSDDTYMREYTKKILNLPFVIGHVSNATGYKVGRQTLHHAWIFFSDDTQTYSEYVGDLRYEDVHEDLKQEVSLQLTLSGLVHPSSLSYAIYIRTIRPSYLRYERSDGTKYLLWARHVATLVPSTSTSIVPLMDRAS